MGLEPTPVSFGRMRGSKLKVRATPTGDGVLRTGGTRPEIERLYN
jgi:hypothetical protein